MKRIILCFAALAVLASPVLATAGTWEIDSSHSSVSFKVRHLFTNVQGSFSDMTGKIEFDPENPEAASVEAMVPATTVNTQNEKRDGHLKSPDFFEVEAFPEITFKSTKVKSTEDGLKVTGDFTMRGVTKPVTLDVEFLGAGAHPMMPGGMVAGFSASTTIKRSDFGMEWNKAIETGKVLGDKVSIQFDIEAVLPGEKTE